MDRREQNRAYTMFFRKSIKLFVVLSLIFGGLSSGLITNPTAGAASEVHKTEVPAGFTGIYTAEDLSSIRNSLSGKYILMNNIDLTSVTAKGGTYYNNGAGWEPIGNEASPFTGILDGNGYNIIGLKMTLKAESTIYAGLFGYAKNAEITNLGIENAKINGESTSLDSDTAKVYAGGIMGYGYNVKISNSFNTGNISADSLFDGYAGGIAGFVTTTYNSLSTISNTYNTGNVSAKTAAGGIAGQTYRTTLTDIYNSGSFTSKTSKYIGGVVGNLSLDSTITNANNKGNIQFGNIGGGIVGYAYEASITDSYNNGELSSTISSSTGGVVGSASNSKIKNTYNSGKITSSAPYSEGGGIAGTLSNNSTITESYNTADVNVTGAVGGIVGEQYRSVISQNYNTGTLSGSFAGGMSGWSSSGTIIESFNIGSINGKYDSGGIAGNSSDTTIKNTYNVGSLLSSKTFTSSQGGIAGEFEGTIENSYYLDKSQLGVGDGIQTGTSKRTFDQMKQSSSFKGFDFNTTWRFDGDSKFRFPLLSKGIDSQTEKSLNLTLSTLPGKVNYILGEPLDVTGGVLTVRTNHGNQFDVPVTKEMVSGYNPAQKGQQLIKVSYDGQYAYYNVTVYTTFNVTFKDHDGTILKTESVIEGKSATAPANPTRAGYTFTGWSPSFNNVISNLTVDAQYQINSYNVTYMDGNTILHTEGYNSDVIVTPPSDPSKNGYTFVGWYADREFKTRYTFFNTLSSDTTIFAKFIKNPDSPQKVSLVSSGFNELKMTWEPVNGIDGYEIARATDKNGPYNYSYTLDKSHKEYEFKWLDSGQQYYFKIRSYQIVNDQYIYSSYTPVTSGKPGVTTVKVLPAGYSKVAVSWTKVNGASGYEIYRSTSLNGTYQRTATVSDGSTITYTNTGLSTGVTYYYKVRAFNVIDADETKGYGPYSNSVSAMSTVFPRFGGADRYAVQANFNSGISNQSLDYVIVTSGLNFPDALSSGVLNNKLNSTTLLVQDRDTIIQSKISEAKRLLKPSGKVLIVGGPGTVSTTIENQFKKYFPVQRISGKDRIAVSINVANRIDANASEIFLTYGLVFSDSLSIVPYATKANIPIVLQSGSGLNAQVKSYLQSHPTIKKVTIVSGIGVIPVSIEKELRSLGVTTVERVAGKNRFDTSLLIAKKYFPKASEVALSNGLIFADALSGSRYAYKKDMPIILVRNNSAIEETKKFVVGLNPKNIYLYGGTGTINDSIKEIFK